MSAAVRRSAAESKRPRSGSALRIVTGIDRTMPKKRRSPDVASESDSDSRPQTPIDASDMRKSELASMFEGPDAGEHFAIFRLPPELAAACAAAADTTTQAAAGAGSGPGGSDQSPSKRRRVGRRSTGIRVYVKKFVHLSDVGLTLWPAAVLLTEQLLAEPEVRVLARAGKSERAPAPELPLRSSSAVACASSSGAEWVCAAWWRARPGPAACMRRT